LNKRALKEKLSATEDDLENERENTRRLEEQIAMLQQMMQQQRLNPNPNGSFQDGYLPNH
jgi:hypothetical protein